MSHDNKKRMYWVIPAVLILAAAFSRLLPHPYNFSPIAGMALLGGAAFQNKKLAFLLPLGALFLSDICFSLFTNVPGFYGISQVINYAAFALIVVLGMVFIKKKKVSNIILTSVGASFLFFMISNLGVWVTAAGIPPYTADGAGLLNTYILGIPFLGNTVVGDLFYSGVLFGAYGLITHYSGAKERSRAIVS